MTTFKDLREKTKKMKGDDPCWDGYEMVGKKKKNGKEVPNCVPKNEEVSPQERRKHASLYTSGRISKDEFHKRIGAGKYRKKSKSALGNSQYKNVTKKIGEDLDLDEKAKSKSQQRLAGMALAYKRGEYDGEPSDAVKDMAKMSEKELEKYAETKHKGLPDQKEDTQLEMKSSEIEAEIREIESKLKDAKRGGNHKKFSLGSDKVDVAKYNQKLKSLKKALKLAKMTEDTQLDELSMDVMKKAVSGQTKQRTKRLSDIRKMRKEIADKKKKVGQKYELGYREK